MSPLKESPPRSHLLELLCSLTKFRPLGGYFNGLGKVPGWGLRFTGDVTVETRNIADGSYPAVETRPLRRPTGGGTDPGKFLPPVLTGKSRSLNAFCQNCKSLLSDCAASSEADSQCDDDLPQGASSPRVKFFREKRA